MSITSMARPSSSVRCAICTRPARRGATLCAQCKAAVKRARQVPSVQTELLPHLSAAAARGPASASGGTRAMPGIRAYPAATRAVPGGWGTYATLIAFGLAVCLTGYLALGEHGGAADSGRASQLTGLTPSTNHGDYAAPARPPLPSLAVDDPAVAERSNPATVTDAEPSPAERERAAARPARDSRQARDKPAIMAFDAGNVDAEPTTPVAAVVEAVAAPPPPVVAESPVPVAPDRWQLLASATSRCERENPIAGFICKERARLQYCDGYWGAAPQCPGITASNNTR